MSNKTEPNRYDVVINGDFTDEPNIKCPICGEDYVHHLSKTIVRDGQDDYKAHPSVRGSTISLPMHCEAGCFFTVIFGFHKGAVYVWAEQRDSFAGEENMPDR